MSYILDALRKSENERRRNAEREQRETGTQSPRSPQYASSKRLPFTVSAVILSVIIIAVFIGLSDNNKRLPDYRVETTVVQDTVNKKSGSTDADAQVRQITKAQEKGTANNLKEFSELPFFWEKSVKYRQGIDPFSVSIHVYAPAPSQRILFINNREYRAGEQTQQGPRVESIEPQGVILSYRGEYFKLPRPR